MAQTPPLKTEEIKDKTCVRCGNCSHWHVHKKNTATGRCDDLKETTLIDDYCPIKDLPENRKKSPS